jgi:hypothetical protein
VVNTNFEISTLRTSLNDHARSDAFLHYNVTFAVCELFDLLLDDAGNLQRSERLAGLIIVRL